MEVDYRGKIHATVPVEVDIELDDVLVCNWLENCTNPETLRYLAKTALNKVREIEHP